MSKNKAVSFKTATLAIIVMMMAASMTGCKEHKEQETTSDKDVQELYEKLKDQDPREYVDKQWAEELHSAAINAKDSLAR